jgi:hypothetical protein
MDASTRRDMQIPNRRKLSFLPRRISTLSVLWRLLCSRGRCARNNSSNDSYDYRYRSGKSARLECPRRNRSDTQSCHAGRRVATSCKPYTARSCKPYIGSGRGVSIPLKNNRPPPRFNQGVSLLDVIHAQLEFVIRELAPFVQAGAWESSTCNDYVSILFLVPKPGNNMWRLICDLRPLNK